MEWVPPAYKMNILPLTIGLRSISPFGLWGRVLEELVWSVSSCNLSNRRASPRSQRPINTSYLGSLASGTYYAARGGSLLGLTSRLLFLWFGSWGHIGWRRPMRFGRLFHKTRLRCLQVVAWQRPFCRSLSVELNSCVDLVARFEERIFCSYQQLLQARDC